MWSVDFNETFATISSYLSPTLNVYNFMQLVDNNTTQQQKIP